MDWPDEPASEHQVMHLKNLGFVPTTQLTMTEAAKLIRQYQKSLRLTGTASGSKPLGHHSSTVSPAQSDLGSVSDSAKHMAYQLHENSERSKRALAIAPTGCNVRADLAVSRERRIEFWLDTCRDMREMQIASVQIYELHHDFGHRLFAPTREQVEEVLEALDAAMPEWDKDHQELFYKTLELNFPQLQRKV